MKERLAELESKKADLEISIAKEQIEKPPLEKQQIVYWISRFKGGDIDNPEYRRAIVDIFVNAVFLYDDELVVGFNWKDGSKAISLKQWEKASSGRGDKCSYLVQSAPAVSHGGQFYCDSKGYSNCHVCGSYTSRYAPDMTAAGNFGQPL